MVQNVQFTYEDQAVSMLFKRFGKNVTCSFNGVLHTNQENEVIHLNGLIPSQFRPRQEIMMGVLLVIGTILSGTARFAYGIDGSVSFVTSTRDAREYHHTVSWIVD